MTTRTLVVRLDSVGDVLLSGPAIAACAAAGPVDVLCSSIGAPAARLLPGVDRTIVFDAPWILDPPPAVKAGVLATLTADLAIASYDAAAILTSSHQSCLPTALLLRLAGVPRIAAVSNDFAGSLLDHRIKGDPDVHEVERSLAVVAELGRHPATEFSPLRLAVEVDDEPVAGRIAIHPGAAVPARTLAPQRWATIAADLTRRGYEVVVTGSEHDADVCTMVADAAKRQPMLMPRADLLALARLLASAEVVVTGNTGPAHLAAAVGRPVASIFPPTVPPSRWAPWGVPYVMLGELDVACAGCRARVCPEPVQWCTSTVTPTAVAKAVAQLGATRPRRRHLEAVTA